MKKVFLFITAILMCSCQEKKATNDNVSKNEEDTSLKVQLKFPDSVFVGDNTIHVHVRGEKGFELFSFGPVGNHMRSETIDAEYIGYEKGEPISIEKDGKTFDYYKVMDIKATMKKEGKIMFPDMDFRIMTTMTDSLLQQKIGIDQTIQWEGKTIHVYDK